MRETRILQIQSLTRWKTVVLASVLMLPLAAGCTPMGMAVGAGATVGTSAASQKGLDGTAYDAIIRTQISRLWFERDHRLLTQVDMTVEERRVLLTGVVSDPQMRVDAVRLAWVPSGVAEVINEIKVKDDGQGVGDFVRDSWITAEVRAKVLFDPKIKSINYSIDVVDRIIYVMGIAQNVRERERVLAWARNASGVRQVMDLTMTVDDPRRLGPREAVNKDLVPAQYKTSGPAVEPPPPKAAPRIAVESAPLDVISLKPLKPEDAAQ